MVDETDECTLDDWAASVTSDRHAREYLVGRIKENGWWRGVRKPASYWQDAANRSGVHPRWCGYRRNLSQ